MHDHVLVVPPGLGGGLELGASSLVHGLVVVNEMNPTSLLDEHAVDIRIHTGEVLEQALV
jgi:hypothetical protein